MPQFGSKERRETSAKGSGAQGRQQSVSVAVWRDRPPTLHDVGRVPPLTRIQKRSARDRPSGRSWEFAQADIDAFLALDIGIGPEDEWRTGYRQEQHLPHP